MLVYGNPLYVSEETKGGTRLVNFHGILWAVMKLSNQAEMLVKVGVPHSGLQTISCEQHQEVEWSYTCPVALDILRKIASMKYSY